MPPAFTFFSRSGWPSWPVDRHRLGIGVLVLLHLVAAAVLLHTEGDLIARLAFLFTWGLLNFLWLLLLRRPSVAASLSLIMVVVLILLSQFKQDILIMSANFVDVMLIDADTASFLLTIFPSLAAKVAAAAGIVLPLLVLFWWLDPVRVRLRSAALGAVVCLAALTGLSFAVPMDREKAFESTDYVSQFARSGALALFDVATRGLMESDSAVRDRLSTAAPASCKPGQRLPHIILVLDEFELRHQRGRRASRCRSAIRATSARSTARSARFLVEGAGGPTWYTEYNVLSRPFGALLRPLRRVRDADRSRPRHAKPAERAAQLRLPHLQHLSLARRVPQRAQLPEDARHRSFL